MFFFQNIMATVQKRRALTSMTLGRGGFARVEVRVISDIAVARKIFPEGKGDHAERELLFNRNQVPYGCFFILALSTLIDTIDKEPYFDMELEECTKPPHSHQQKHPTSTSKSSLVIWRSPFWSYSEAKSFIGTSKPRTAS